MKNALFNKLFYFSAILIIAGILLKLSNNFYALYLIGAGSFLFLIIRLMLMLQARQISRNASRIPFIKLLSASSLLVMTYYIYEGSNSWAVFAFISATLELYVSYREE